MNPIAPQKPRNQGEAAAYNQGVLDVLTIATRSAETIGAPHDKRHIPKSFAAVALDELAVAGAALLIGNGDAAALVLASVPPASPAPAEAVAS